MVSFILPGNSATGGYEVANSCRFNDGSSDYLTFTPSGNGNRKVFTVSAWVKRGSLGINSNIIGSSDSGFGNGFFIQFQSGDNLRVGFQDPNQFKATNRLFRDVSAWLHIVVAVDVTQSSNSDKIKIYVNGVQETSFSTDNTITNADKNWNNTQAHSIGRSGAYNSQYFDGYLAEVVNVDGLQLAPTSFGEFDSDSPNIWKPINVSGLTFGNNGFYLDFEDSSALGNDKSGNDNDFTVNNLTSIDQTTDTCTNNFATFNPLMSLSTGNSFPTALTDGNTINSDTRSGGDARSLATIAVPRTGKWYYECKVISGGAYISIGLFQYLGNAVPTKWARYYGASGIKNLDGTSTSYGATFTNNDIIGCLADIENNQITFYKNGESQGAISYTFASGEDYFMTAGDEAGTSHSVAANFGNPAFTISSGNSDPAGYGNFEYSTDGGYALNTKNLAEFG